MVLFKSDDERNEAHGRFMQALMTHPAALAAGGFVMIGPTRTQCVDLKAKTVAVTRAEESAWEPSAISDFAEH